jgi:uncharacterized protein YndB with AHSA1/START domain
MTDVTVEETIAAPPQQVYELVSDVTRMGQWSPETTACRWLDGASGAAVGARFRGANRQGWRRWSTTCTVVEADLGRRFSFNVRYGPLRVARWDYEFVPEGDGCRVTESWTDRRSAWMARMGATVMGIRDRAEHNRETMQATLAQLSRFVAAGATGS